MAARMANLLEGLDFPTTKKEIIIHIGKHGSNNNNKRTRNILSLVQRKLLTNSNYNSAYEVEIAANLIVKRK